MRVCMDFIFLSDLCPQNGLFIFILISIPKDGNISALDQIKSENFIICNHKKPLKGNNRNDVRSRRI